MSVNLLKAALYYAEKFNWPVVALHSVRNGKCTCSKGEDCDNPGKHPRWDKDLLPHGVKSATTDTTVIQQWWKKWPAANVGIATGESSFDVLDVDLKGEGPDTLRDLEHEHGELPDTVEQITGSGGRQVMFQHSGKIGNKVRFASGLDTRSDKGLVVVPPSLHISGNRYEWEASSRPGAKELKPCPGWLIALIGGANNNGGAEGHVDVEKLFEGIPEGSRDQELFRYACRLRNQGLNRAEAELLVKQAAAACRPPFPEADALQKVGQAWKYDSGHNDSVSSTTEQVNYQSFPFTDFGNAERFASHHKDMIRFCHSWGKWLVWSGKHWEIDETGHIRQLAKETARRMYADAAQLDDDDLRKCLVKHARACESATKITSFLTLAQTEPVVATKSSDLDKDPWLLNLENGTLDLRTGKLRPHCWGELITKLAPVAFSESATCPLWLTFLDRVMGGSSELIQYLQKLTGYCLTGDTREKCLPVLYGIGDNGKTIFTATIGGMLGDYAQETPVDGLMIKRGEAIPNDIARLKGARLVTASEGERGQRLAESLIKRLTGGDKISARFLHQEWFEFTPEFKIWLSTNHKPVIRGSDNAIWNRIHLVPFEVIIPKAEQIPRTVLLERLRGEWPGILRWAVEGCLLWQKEGLEKPEEVTRATDDYRTEMDILAGFMADCCIINPLAKSETRVLYAAYTQWCGGNQEEPLKKNAFGSILQERGFKPVRIGHKQARGWQGLRLRTENHADTQTDADSFSRISHIEKNKEEKNPKTTPGSVCCVCASCRHFTFADPPNLPGQCSSTHPLDGNRKQFPHVPHDCEGFQQKEETRCKN